MPEVLDIVDENDNVIGTATKDHILKQNLIHRGVVIFIFNSKGEIFVHKRTADKKIYPNMWSMTCGGSAVSGEDFLEAAKRETTEETGVKNPKLEFLFMDRYRSKLDNVIADVYKLKFDGNIKIEKKEIEKGFFISVEELKELIKKEPFCPDALQYFKKYGSKKIKSQKNSNKR